ncbi:hypothetical protein [Nocardia sp. NPDC004722]
MTDHTAGDVHITGGNVVAGNIGGIGNSSEMHGPVTMNITAETDQLRTTLEQLRDELAQLRGMLPATAGPDAHPDEVSELIEELERPEPDARRVVGKWHRLLQRIPAPLRSIDSITRIVDLIAKVEGLVS